MALRQCGAQEAKKSLRRMASFSVLWLALLGLLQDVQVAEGSIADESRLRRDIISKYDALVRPAHPTQVSIRITVVDFHMNEALQTLDMDIWLSLGWTDPRLMWDPEDYSDVMSLTFEYQDIWHPDIALFTDGNLDSPTAPAAAPKTLSMVDSMGDVRYIPPGHVKVPCVMDLTLWPYDSHQCLAKFGSWLHDSSSIDLTLLDDRPNLDLLDMFGQESPNRSRGGWTIDNSSMRRRSVAYVCCPYPYVDVTLNITVSRSQPALTWTVITPAVVLSVTTLLMFLLPPCAIEKVVFGAITLLTQIIFLGFTTSWVKHAPTHTPVIVQLVVGELVLAAAGLVVSCLVVRAVRDPHPVPLPACVKGPAVSFSYLLMLASYREMATTEHRALGGKGDELEIALSHVYADDHPSSSATHSSASSTSTYCTASHRRLAFWEWKLLGACIDRIFFIVFLIILAINLNSISFAF
ncbi:acetylcholine receptor subunit alpha-1-A-like [Oratosquilla oratoria]|uniref:acetylcholine receptor subunit alpha-1-A-like n=1 Tax=Oratosquilla oratoria TaxID=337810 RepID=UPI003F776238